MGKWTQAVCLVFWSVPVLAGPVNLTCTTDPLTTSVAVFTQGKEVTLRIIHHNGMGSIPLASGTVIPRDLPRLTEAAKSLSMLGSQYDLHFEANACTVSGGQLVDCHGASHDEVNGHHFSWVSFDTSLSVTTAAISGAPYRQTTLNLSFTLDGQDYAFSLPYPAKGCVETGMR